ncbi:MAG: hypothetical protein E6G41_17175 [Actinobacteria bacterium]|nr:MAG: hypothetical protein E6G41_17175 [Actinomycetota bacterium]
MGRAARDVLDARAARVPVATRRRRRRGHRDRDRRGRRSPATRRDAGAPVRRLQTARAIGARLGRPARGGADRARHHRPLVQGSFFAVVLSTVLQGATFESFARLLGATTDEQALPAPLLEPGAVRRLGAEVVQFAVGPGDAVVGHPVRELGLPRDALLNLVVRGEQAIPPRGSTVIEAGDHLHVLVRQEAAPDFGRLLRRWREGPIAPRPQRPVGQRAVSIFSTGRGMPVEGDLARPASVKGLDVIDHRRSLRLHGSDPGDRLGASATGCRALPPRTCGGRRGARVVAGGDRRTRGRAGLTSVLRRAYSRAPKEHSPHLLSPFPPRGEARG